VAGGRALDRTGPTGSPARRRYARAYGANLLLNAGWSWLFFRARRPDVAAVEAVLLSASTVDLARRTWHLDPAAGRALVPYAAWTTFAAALTASIARRNR
jgi:tryptophan-rich sensory protein